MGQNARIQKQWVAEQTSEKEAIANCLKNEEAQYAAQTDNITRMRGMLEDEMTMRKKQQLAELQAYNKQLAQDKRNREKAWKDNQEAQNTFEITRTNMSDIMTENPGTTVSKLAPHRYVPYHFKGLKPEQVEGIDMERYAQTVERKQLNRAQADEDQQWAVQNLANTQEQLNNEVALQNQQAHMNASTRDHNLTEKEAKDARWPNMYGDLNPLPDVA